MPNLIRYIINIMAIYGFMVSMVNDKKNVVRERKKLSIVF